MFYYSNPVHVLQHALYHQVLKGQYHAIFSNTLKIERRYSVDSSQDIMTKIPLKDYQN